MSNPNPPQSPLIRGEVGATGNVATFSPNRGEAGAAGGIATPSPDKGRAGEGFGFPFLPYKKNLTALARENRKNPTPAETLVWNKVLRSRQFSGYKFLRQKPIGGYIIDFYCSELQLVIEIDGESHAEQIEYDAERTRFLVSLGLNVIHYTNLEVLNNLEGVSDDLTAKIKAAIDRIQGKTQ